VEFLKALFENRGDSWAICNLAVIPLKSDSAEETNFYPVRNDIFTLQPNYISTIQSTIGQSIVPVVSIIPGEDVVRCLGTGFFISCTGLLITAAHVILDPLERSYGGIQKIDDENWFMGQAGLGVMLRTNPIFQLDGYRFRPIEWAALLASPAQHPLPIRGIELKLTSDTAICKVAPAQDGSPYQPLTILQPGIRGFGLRVGKGAIAIGYAGMHDVDLAPEAKGLRGGDFRFDLHVSKGTVLERFPDNAVNRAVSTPGACFSASLKLPPGMSGSPIFDDERIYVHGVVSKGWQDESGVTDFGYGSMLHPSLGLPVRSLEGKSILDLLLEGKHGIPQMMIPDA
jgi:hypothetical protein